MKKHLILPLAMAFAVSFSPWLQAEQVIFSEVMYNPSGTKAEWIEVKNSTTNQLDMANWQMTNGVSLTLPDFNAGSPSAHFLIQRERIILSSKTPAETRADYPNIPVSTRIFGPWTGSLDNAGETLTLKDKNGGTMATLSYGDGGRKWPVAPDGYGHSLVIKHEDRACDEWYNWRASTVAGGTPGAGEVLIPEEAAGDPSASLPSTFSEVVPMTASWRFYKELQAPPLNWNANNFVPDGSWGTGPALLGFETATLPAPGLQTAVSTTNLLTYYFRSSFNWTGGTGPAQFQIDAILDDGATYYINGVYIGNKDALEAVVHNTSVATATVGDGALVANAVTGQIPAGVLVNGTNTFAAICLQVNSTSSDMIFGSNLRLSAAPAADLVLNEVKQGAAGNGFIEVYNPGTAAVDLAGYYFSDTAGQWTKFPITTSVSVPAGGLATIGFVESGFSATSATTTLYMSRPDGNPMFGISTALPQDGRSLGRKPIGGTSWFKFASPTPGTANQSSSSETQSFSSAALNEVHFDTATGHADWVEITNPGQQVHSLNGLFVASATGFADKVALTGTLAPGGFASVAVDFIPDGSGDLNVFIVDAANNVQSEVELTRPPAVVALQAWPAGSAEFYTASAGTRDAANAPNRNGDIVMSEIMYNPPSSHRQAEYIELHNRGASSVDVGNWRFTSGISFTIPAGTSIPAGGYLVVAQCAAYISANYSGVSNVVGDYGGSLGNTTDLIRLVDANGNLADEVNYGSGGDWPVLADGRGSSIELRHPSMNNDIASSWEASNESQKGQWTEYTYTGFWRNRITALAESAAEELHFGLAADGEVILKDITMANAATPTATTAVPLNLSPTNVGSDGWRVSGNHASSFTDAEGFHIVADGPADNKGNGVERDYLGFATNYGFTIKFSARWVQGISRLVLETPDGSWGRTFAISIPNNLGTPGVANSRMIASAAPEIASILHSPPVPKAADNVLVTARVSSSQAATVNLKHRLDTVAGNGAWNTTVMVDNGTNGDVQSGDGVYSATITAYKTQGAIVQFYAEATAGATVTNYPRGGAVLPAMWIVDNTALTSDLLTERFVMSQYDHTALNGASGYSATYGWRHPRMSNRYYNATVIYNEKDILYNVETRKSGSPWTREAGNAMGRIRWKMPKDRMFRGREKTGADDDASKPDADANQGRFRNRVVRYLLYLMSYPTADAEFTFVKFNNLGAVLKDDVEPTDTDMLARYYDSPGSSELYEIDDAWYFDDTIDGSGTEPTRNPQDGNWRYDLFYGDSPVYWNGSWPIHTKQDTYDYSSLASFIRVVWNNGTSPAPGSADDLAYKQQMDRIFDFDGNARYTAVRGFCAEWDHFTATRGKNAFFYRRPSDGKFEFHHWDSDLGLQAGQDGMVPLSDQNGTGVLNSRPYFRRLLYSSWAEIIEKWSENSPRMNAWLQAMEDQSPSYVIDQAYYKARFTARKNACLSLISTGTFNTAYALTSSNGGTVTVASATITGTAPSRVWTLVVDGHPEAIVDWTSVSAWRISGLILRQGVNTFTIRAFDRQGVDLGSQVYTITKSNDAAPIVMVEADPDSYNIGIGEPTVLDAFGSYDPEATALTYNWSVSPSIGVTSLPDTPTARRFVFSVPGNYVVTLQVTDGAGTSTTVTREISVYNGSDFLAFGGLYKLPTDLTAINVELRDNYSPTSWYSMEDIPGRLQLQVTEEGARSLDSGTFPYVTRDLPDSSNWILQSDISFDSRHIGSFNGGLMVEMLEGGIPVKYAFGPETRSELTLRRSDPSNPFFTDTIPPVTYPPAPIVYPAVRINCGGPAVTEADGRSWIADDYFTGSTSTMTQDFNGSNAAVNTINDTKRLGSTFTYTIPVPGNDVTYTVILHTNALTVADTVTQSYSVFNGATQVGASSSWNVTSSTTAERQRSVSNVPATSGAITIVVTRTSGTSANAHLSAIEVVPNNVTGAPVPANPPLPTLKTTALTEFDALRVQRSGDSLLFSHRWNGVWTLDATRAVPAGSTTYRGGVFLATRLPENVRMNYDYFMVIDPTNSSSVLANLRITEVMYNPAPAGVEFIEFRNTGAAGINLAGVTLAEGQPVAQYVFGNETLAPGEFIVLTENVAAFQAKYGNSIRLAGAWAAGGLNNAGEKVVLSDAQGNVIHDFTYDDIAPWPLAADGTGPSMEVIDVNGNYNDGNNWRASGEAEGSPGKAGIGPDTDGDGVPDSVESMFGTSVSSANSKPAAIIAKDSNGKMTLTWPSVPGRSYCLEASDNLVDWAILATVQAGSLEDVESLIKGRRYYRVTAKP